MTTWANGTKNNSSYSNLTKNISSWIDTAKTVFNQFLLQESGFYLLLETGDKVILEQSVPIGNTWTTQVKN